MFAFVMVNFGIRIVKLIIYMFCARNVIFFQDPLYLIFCRIFIATFKGKLSANMLHHNVVTL